MTIQGTPKFNGIAVAKIEVDFLRNPVHIDVQAAFVNVKTGDTHGWTRGTPGWSDKTRELISSLRLSMEEDLAARHLEGGASPVSSASSSKVGGEPTGLGEFLGSTQEDGGNGVPSV
jgi:hypothetical protein